MVTWTDHGSGGDAEKGQLPEYGLKIEPVGFPHGLTAKRSEESSLPLRFLYEQKKDGVISMWMSSIQS